MQLKAQIMYCLMMLPVLYVIEFGVLLNYQVAGLTNNSYIAEAHEVRHCVQKYKTLGKYVLQVAKVLNKLFKWDSCIMLLFAFPYWSFFNTVMAHACTYCRKDWMICYMLVLRRNTENLQRNLQMWLVLKWYHSLMHQMLAWKLLIIQVSVVKHFVCVQLFLKLQKQRFLKWCRIWRMMVALILFLFEVHILACTKTCNIFWCVLYHILKWSLVSILVLTFIVLDVYCDVF